MSSSSVAPIAGNANVHKIQNTTLSQSELAANQTNNGLVNLKSVKGYVTPVGAAGNYFVLDSFLGTSATGYPVQLPAGAVPVCSAVKPRVAPTTAGTPSLALGLYSATGTTAIGTTLAATGVGIFTNLTSGYSIAPSAASPVVGSTTNQFLGTTTAVSGLTAGTLEVTVFYV